jgi:GDP-4-dehydro-6-deoxy-D-mannose reductase
VRALDEAGIDTLAIVRRGRPGLRVFVHELSGRPAALEARLRRHDPDVVFHLAGPSSDSDAAMTEALGASEHLLEACLRLPRRPLVVAVSSSAVYGAGGPVRGITERQPVRPETRYGVAKAVQELLALRAGARGLPVVIARLFNVIGEGQSGHRVPATFVRQLLDLGPKRAPRTMAVRNLEAGRDFIDVADAVAALQVIAARGTEGEVYNVCTGRARLVGELLDKLIAASGVTGLRISSRQDGEVAWQRGSAARLRALGWRPSVPLDASLQRILADWRARG